MLSNEKPSKKIVFQKWHKNDDGIYYLSNNENSKNKEKNESKEDNEKNSKKVNILELCDEYKSGMFVMTEWGPGKISSVNLEEKTCKVKIEDQECPFPFDTIKTSLNLCVCIVDKIKTYWGLINIQFTDTVKSLRIKIGNILNVHFSQVIIVKGGQKLKNNDSSILDLDFFEKDKILVVIKDETEKRFFRFKTDKTLNLNSGFNSISIKASDDIFITGFDLYKNSQKDIIYEIKIFDYKKNIIFDEKNIIVEKFDKKDFSLKYKKYELENFIFIKKNTNYEIQQIITYEGLHDKVKFYLKDQIIGNSLDNEKSWDHTIISVSEVNSKENKQKNMTSVYQGLIPSFYYSFKDI